MNAVMYDLFCKAVGPVVLNLQETFDLHGSMTSYNTILKHRISKYIIRYMYFYVQ